MTKQEKEIIEYLEQMAEEQVLFLKNNCQMNPQEIIHLYGGSTLGDETYSDAVERITTFNMFNAGKNGFVVN